jgi:hypothetical protein
MMQTALQDRGDRGGRREGLDCKVTQPEAAKWPRALCTQRTALGDWTIGPITASARSLYPAILHLPLTVRRSTTPDVEAFRRYPM